MGQKMILLGITGAIGHGKSTFAQALQNAEPDSIHLESHHLIAEVIDKWHTKLTKPIKAGDYDSLNKWLVTLVPIIKEVTHQTTKSITITRDVIAADPIEYQKLLEHLDRLVKEPALAQQKITDSNKADYRPILQWVGGYFVTQVYPGIWFEELVRRAQAAGQKGTSLAIISAIRFPSDARIIQAAGGSIIQIIRPELEEKDLTDPTERERKQIQVDITVSNNGSLKNLEAVAKKVLNDIRKRTVQTSYAAV